MVQGWHRRVGGPGANSSAELPVCTLPCDPLASEGVRAALEQTLCWQSSGALPWGSQPCVSFFIPAFKIAFVVITSAGTLAVWPTSAELVQTATLPSARHSPCFHFPKFLGALNLSQWIHLTP